MTWALVVALAPLRAAAQNGQDLGCLIEPNVEVELSTREVGTIQELLVDRGDWVRQGDIVARLDDEIEAATVDLATASAQMQAEIEEAQTSVDFAERELERITQLYNQKAVSFRERDGAATDAARARLRLTQAKQRQKVARLELRRAKRLLERRALRSPIDGVVVEQLISAGESVENRSILRIAKVDPLNVEVIVPVSLFGSIAAGMQAEVLPRYPGAKTHGATVKVVDPVVDAASNTFGVRLELANPERAIPAGVRCDVRFTGKLATDTPPPPKGSESSSSAVETAQTHTEASDAHIPSDRQPSVPPTTHRRRATTGVYYRAGPGEEHARLGSLSGGTEVTVEAIENGWYRIVLDTGGRAYVHADYLSPAVP